MASDLELTASGPAMDDSASQPRKFQTIQDIREYLSGDKIECLVCHKHYRRLQYKHLETHSMNVEEYKERFGIPWNTSLTSKPSREKSSAAMTPERVALFMQIPRYKPPVGQIHRPHAPAVRAQWKKNAVAGRNAGVPARGTAVRHMWHPCADNCTHRKSAAQLRCVRNARANEAAPLYDPAQAPSRRLKIRLPHRGEAQP